MPQRCLCISSTWRRSKLSASHTSSMAALVSVSTSILLYDPQGLHTGLHKRQSDLGHCPGPVHSWLAQALKS